MSASSEISPSLLYAARVRLSKLDWVVVALVAVCTIPAMATIDVAKPGLGARYLSGTLFLLLGYYGMKRDRYRFMALLLGAEPALALMRGLFFYDEVPFFLLAGMALWASVAWDEVKFLWQDPIWKSLMLLCGLYWVLSAFATLDWQSNLRVLELPLGAGAVCLVSKRRACLATAIVAMAVSLSAYAIAMLPYGVRLGEGELDNGMTIGNPVSLGVPAALLVLVALADRGRLLLMEKNFLGKIILCMSAAEWLVLSGSRGSWAVTIVCLILVFAFNKASRKPLLIAVFIGALATVAVLSTDRGDKITNVFSKTVDSDRTWANRTSGRSSMWAALPDIFATSPIWGWGPGTSRDVDFVYTHRHLELHSLYLQVIAETGLLGTIPLFIILGALLRRAVGHVRRYGEVMPLVGIVGFMFIGVSVTAFDFISGIYLGLAFMAREANPRFYGFRVWQAPALEHPVNRLLR